MITVDYNDAELQTRLNLLRSRLGDLTPVMRDIGNEVVNMMREYFADSKDPWGTAWAPLIHRAGQPLLDTGRMRNSIFAVADSDGVTIKSADTPGKVRMHQFGGVSRGMYRGSTIPARPFFPIRNNAADLPGDMSTAIVNIVERYLVANP